MQHRMHHITSRSIFENLLGHQHRTSTYTHGIHFSASTTQPPPVPSSRARLQASLESVTLLGWTALTRAALRQRTAVTQWLLERGQRAPGSDAERVGGKTSLDPRPPST